MLSAKQSSVHLDIHTGKEALRCSFFLILFWIGQDVGAAISDNYSVCSQDWARMEEQISGLIAVKNPNDPKNMYEKAPAVAQ